MTVKTLQRRAFATRHCPVRWHETAIDELMISVAHNLKRLTKAQRQAKAASIMANILKISES